MPVIFFLSGWCSSIINL